MSRNESEIANEGEGTSEQETSRRGLLVAGAAAVVGAAAVGGAAATQAKAESLGAGVWLQAGSNLVRLPDTEYVANNDLAKDLQKIALAYWDGFKVGNDETTQAQVEEALTSTSYKTVKEMIQKIVKTGNGTHKQDFEPDKPVFITMEDYNNGYVKRSADEVVFVFLPKPEGTDTSTNRKGGSVRAVMAAVPFGM